MNAKGRLPMTALVVTLGFVLLTASKQTVAQQKLRLSPQQAVDFALGKGREARLAELNAQRSYLQLENARSTYDLSLESRGSHEIDEAEALAAFNNPKDTTTSFSTTISKRIKTGTVFSAGYEWIRQESILNPFQAQSRPPTLNQSVLSLSVRQPLLRNFFGFADRLLIEAAEQRVQQALETREENLEDVLLNVMTLYWNAYVAQQQLKENIAARDKYDQLVRNVRRKAGFNLSTPGELPRLEAELEIADSRVKQSSSQYLTAVESLLTAIQLQSSVDIEFDIPQEIPPVPKLEAVELENLRPVRVARIAFENSERDVRLTRVAGLPQFDLLASARTVGVDPSGDRATAEMVGATKPIYLIGFEMRTPLDSALVRGELADRRVAQEQGRLNLEVARETTKNRLADAERLVSANFATAQSLRDAVAARERVVRQLEISYRQGRQPLVELIRAYNELFQTQLEKARALGQYHISLNQLAAARDELVKENQK